MRIAVVAPPWVSVPPPAYGGTEAVLDTLARGFLSAGHDVLLFATGDSTCPVPLRWARRTAAGTVCTGSATEMHHVINAYEAVVEWRPDVVHDHTLIGPVFAQQFDLSVVTTNHGPFGSELHDYYEEICESVPIIAISEHHASTADGIRIAAVIHHGVDVDRFPYGRGDGGYALFLGRMSPDKGVHHAIRAAKEAGVPLKIAAKMREPAEHAYFETTIVPQLGDSVDFVGEVGGDEKLRLLADACCLLNPIEWPEPFGMVMIEALACGTPVVATPHGSVPEIVREGTTGCICDIDGLVEGICRSRDLSRAACRDDAAERFSGTLMVQRHVELFERVITRG